VSHTDSFTTFSNIENFALHTIDFSTLFPTPKDITGVDMKRYFYWNGESEESQFKDLLDLLCKKPHGLVSTYFSQTATRWGKKNAHESPSSAIIVFFVLLIPHLASLNEKEQLIDGGYYDGNTTQDTLVRQTGRLRKLNDTGIRTTKYKEWRMYQLARSTESVKSPLVLARMVFKSNGDLSDTGMTSTSEAQMKTWLNINKKQPVLLTDLEAIELKLQLPAAEIESPPKQLEEEKTTRSTGRKRKPVVAFKPNEDLAPASNDSKRKKKRQDTASSASNRVNYAQTDMDKLLDKYKNDTSLARTMHTLGILIQKIESTARVPKHITEFVESNVKHQFFQEHKDCFLPPSPPSNEEDSNELEPTLTKEDVKSMSITMPDLCTPVKELDINFVLEAFQWKCNNKDKVSQMNDDIQKMPNKWYAFTVDKEIGDAIRNYHTEAFPTNESISTSSDFIKQLEESGWTSNLSPDLTDATKIVLCWTSEHTKFLNRLKCKSPQMCSTFYTLSLSLNHS